MFSRLLGRVVMVGLAVIFARLGFFLILTEYNWHVGNQAYRQARYGESIERYSAAIEFGRKCGGDESCLYCDRGDAYDMVGRLDEALADYATAIRFDAKVPRYYYERAIAFRRAKRYQEAMVDLEQAIALAPTTPSYYYERAVSLEALGDYRKAIAALDRYRTLAARDKVGTSGRDYRSYDLRGWAHYKLGETSEALADYNEALKINPTYAQAFHDRAELEASLGQTEQAQADYKEAEKYSKAGQK